MRTLCGVAGTRTSGNRAWLDFFPMATGPRGLVCPGRCGEVNGGCRSRLLASRDGAASFRTLPGSRIALRVVRVCVRVCVCAVDQAWRPRPTSSPSARSSPPRHPETPRNPLYVSLGMQSRPRARRAPHQTWQRAARDGPTAGTTPEAPRPVRRVLRAQHRITSQHACRGRRTRRRSPESSRPGLCRRASRTAGRRLTPWPTSGGAQPL